MEPRETTLCPPGVELLGCKKCTILKMNPSDLQKMRNVLGLLLGGVQISHFLQCFLSPTYAGLRPSPFGGRPLGVGFGGWSSSHLGAHELLRLEGRSPAQGRSHASGAKRREVGRGPPWKLLGAPGSLPGSLLETPGGLLRAPGGSWAPGGLLGASLAS